jgi:hypothetical protein
LLLKKIKNTNAKELNFILSFFWKLNLLALIEAASFFVFGGGFGKGKTKKIERRAGSWLLKK